MKDYHEVVEHRFNKEKNPTESIYSSSHPVGRHTRHVIYSAIRNFISTFYPDSKSIKEKKLLDLGCGEGVILQFFGECGFSPEHCTGVDFSYVRIMHARSNIPGIRFVHGDAISIQLQDQFDLVVSFDLFSHFAKREQIIEGLKNAVNHLSPAGLFLWYDIFSKDHFSSPENADSWGFNKRQMLEMANEAGLEAVYSRHLFKRFFNKYHSAYQAKRIPPGLLRLLEKIVPGTAGNLLVVFRKKTG